jgi:gliding motility-associated-like protein
MELLQVLLILQAQVNTFNWVNDTPGIGLAAIGSGNIAAFTAVNNTDAAITATITVTPVKLTGGYAYISNYGSNNISVINTATNTVVATIPVGKNPDDVSVTPDGTKVYVSNQGDNTISVIDVASNTVSATIPIGISPEGIAISPDGNTLYIGTGYNAITVVNTNTNAIITTILVGGNPHGITINRDGSRVYVANSTVNAVSVINTATNKVIATIQVGTQPEGVTVSPDGSTLYVSDYGADSVSIVSTALNATILTVAVGNNPEAIRISPDGSKVYVANSNNGGSVSVIQTATEYVESIIKIFNPSGISFSQDGSKVYIPSFGLDTAFVFNTNNNSLNAKVAIGIFPSTLGNFVTGGSGCPGSPIQFTIVVEPTFPTITATGDLSPLSTIYGTPSASTNFTVSGIFLAEGILVSPPPGFEVSTDGITFSSTVIAGGAGSVASVTIYIRLASTTHVGNNYGGNIVLSSKGALPINLAMPLCTVTPASLTVKADDKSKFYGEINPTLTVTYTGFVNSDGPPQLMTLPLITTTAVTESPVGKYVITPTFATSIDYTFTYIAGVLTVSPILPITIPNAFTPNGDNINDTWNIKSIEAYPHCTVDIFNRYGVKLFSSIGYPIPWDGRYNGKPVPAGTYYYIINLKNGYSQLAGFVAVIR